MHVYVCFYVFYLFTLLTQFGNRIEFVVTTGRPANAIDAFVKGVKGAGGAVDNFVSKTEVAYISAFTAAI